MKVSVTGASGFIGSHCVGALHRAGHTVRTLVRSPQKFERALEMQRLTSADVEVVEGDVTDSGAVKRALDGCDAVLHAAGVLRLDPNQAAEMARVNPESTDLILHTGRDLGLDPLVYVSTAGIFLPPQNPRVQGDGPISAGYGPYTRSKAAAEDVARRHADEGAPVVALYPGVVIGPSDPNEALSDSMAGIRDVVKGPVLPLPLPCLLPVVDVRDVADLATAVMTPGRGRRHYLFGGRYGDVRDVIAAVNRLTGRDVSVVTVSGGVLRAGSKLCDWISLRTGKPLPLTLESVDAMLASKDSPDVSFDQRPADTDFGLPRIPLEESLRDTIQWLHETGRISPGHAGKLAR